MIRVILVKRDEIINVLSENILFAAIDIDQIEYLLSLCEYNIEYFEKNNVISNEGDNCKKIGFILDGKISAVKLNHNGSHMVVRSMGRCDFFGDALVFSSKQECPTNIITIDKSTVMFISYENLLSLCEIDEVFLKNFLRSLSDKIFLLNEKIKILSYPSVRQRLSYFLIKQSQLQQTKDIVLSITREELSELLGTARPSVSRELSRMFDDELISVDGKHISILNFEEMEYLI